MARYLVVAHQTAASPELMEKLRELSDADDQAAFVLLVPATPIRHLLTWEEGDAAAVARSRATAATYSLREAGFHIVDTVVGPADPLVAIAAEHGRRQPPYALTVISTLPPGISRWLRLDLPSKVAARLGVPVAHVVVREARVRPSETSADEEIVAPSTGAGPSLRVAAGWRGRRLHCLDGLLGDVHEILYDYATLEPLWLGIRSRPLPFRTLLVPTASLTVRDGALVAPFRRQRIIDQPPIAIGEGFSSLSEEEAIYEYFGIPFSTLRDVRVLHLGQEYPGMEMNEQDILALDSGQRTTPDRRPGRGVA
jgi:hypothetical protein